ncbi:MAG TPA: MucB/RseB C-terminal domain-containing protein [Casimicrobiaceae bacterium]|nr:MucB/RseB C-terminal domain-containing protein [Casimicrobiaceae bacterium]
MTGLAAIEASLRRAASSGAAAALAVVFGATSVPAAAAGSAEPQDAVSLLSRAAGAARSLNYIGTLVYQHAGRVETSRIVHWNDGGNEYEKLVNLEGPPREVIRSSTEARCYYPDAKIVRIEPRTFRNAFPALSIQQQKALTDYYELRRAEADRVAGLDVQAWVFEPRDGLRYGQKLWFERGTGLLLKARIQNERNEPVEQFTFTDIVLGAHIDRDMVRPTWPPAPPTWQIQTGPGDADAAETGWVVRGAPPGFSRVAEGYRTARGKRAPVAHIVYSDGLVAVSVFVEPAATVHPAGLLQQGGVNVFIRDVDGYVVTALGEAPAATIRQIANSVARR